MTCPICTEPFSAQEALTILPCLHAFHANCINAWLQLSTDCPGCPAQSAQSPLAVLQTQLDDARRDLAAANEANDNMQRRIRYLETLSESRQNELLAHGLVQEERVFQIATLERELLNTKATLVATTEALRKLQRNTNATREPAH